MSVAFDRAIAFVLPHETEYARGHWGDDAFAITENVAGDSGGLTKYGIDQASQPDVNIRNLTREGAIEIYRNRYWGAHGLDRLPKKLAICAFDVWVNGGHAWLWLQHAYNVTHPGAVALTEDGNLGPVSLAALHGADGDSMVTEFLRERDARFAALAERPSRAKFLHGWLARDSDLRSYLLVT